MPVGRRDAVSIAVEGTVDEAVLRRVLATTGWPLGRVFGRRGKTHLRARIPAYNHAARWERWVVLVDLDQDAPCAAAFRRDWLAAPAPMMHFRVAVRETEAWLLADADAFSKYLGVRKGRVPESPDELPNPKRTIVDLARQSRYTETRREFVPTLRSGREVGRGYNSAMIEFVRNHWRPDVAASRSDSLRRCLASLRRASD